MNIVKPGIPQRNGSFHFCCKKCGCEWYADRGDKGLNFSPPCMEFFAIMSCPNCRRETVDREIRRH